ncbi:unnamed protein product [Schistosoma curassoni]|uniref:Secreted protein n=1 Tax=Schistosoma curassoni TaxID=6186 RepID=A0A183KEA1_9TREM|nr:unnamed protein product [Schistosoma curassoni]
MFFFLRFIIINVTIGLYGDFTHIGSSAAQSLDLRCPKDRHSYIKENFILGGLQKSARTVRANRKTEIEVIIKFCIYFLFKLF